MNPTAITLSLERAAELGGDITPRVYEHLFARFPEMLPLFVRDTTGAARGEMLSQVIELILDILDKDHYGTNFIRAEVVTHEGYGVPRDTFPKFFISIVATLKDVLGSEWTDNIDESWSALTNKLTAAATIA